MVLLLGASKYSAEILQPIGKPPFCLLLVDLNLLLSLDQSGSDDNRLLINIDSIKFNDGKVNMHQHGDIKVGPAS